MNGEVRGIVAAVLTPFDAALQPDAALAIPYYRDLLAGGCDALNVLGTSGEAMSLSAAQRISFMETIAGAGLPMHRMMVGTGAAALDDAVRLTKAAFDCGFAAALVMPPFFYRDAGSDGIVSYYEHLFSAVDPPEGGILLYNFPRMSGITFSAALVARLTARFPRVIAGVKDSSNDLGLQRDILALNLGLAVFPGTEETLVSARRAGCAGCISGSVCLWSDLAATVWRDQSDEGERRLHALRGALIETPLSAAVRRRVARTRNDERWLTSMPPLRSPYGASNAAGALSGSISS